MKRRNKPVLPGLSRSVACMKTKSCARLDGHRKACRPTLSARASVTRNDFVVEKGVEVLSFDKYTVTAEPKARKARRAVGQCRVAKAGISGPIRCDRTRGHKAAGKRHHFVGLVTILPEGESKRLVADTSNGQLRTARRARRAPAGRRDVTIAELLQVGA